MATAQQQMNGQPMNGSYYNNEQQQASSTSSAQAVGEQFQRQYYDILSKQPIDLYRFYTDHSKMTTIHLYENAPPKIASVTGQKGIYELVNAADFSNCTPELVSMQAQPSQAEGIAVSVMGYIRLKGARWSFSQNFFLAVQEKGYYVLNDICHYRKEPHDATLQAASTPKAPQAQANGAHAAPTPSHPAQPSQAAPAVPQQHLDMHAQQVSRAQAPAPPLAATPSPAPTASTPPAAASTPQQPQQSFAQPPQQQQHHQQQPAAPAQAAAAPRDEPAAAAAASRQQPSAASSQPAAPKPATEETPAQPAAAAAPAAAAPKPQATPTPAAAAPAAAPEKPAAAAPVPSPRAAAEQATAPQASAAAAEPASGEPAAAPSPQKEPANLTYAESVRMGAAKKAQEKAAATTAAAPSEAPAPQPRRPQPTATSQPPAAAPTSTPLADSDPIDNSGGADEAVSSIFVKNLPQNVTQEKLFNTFQQYGTIKGGMKGVLLRNTRNSSNSAPGRENTPRDVVAFIEFTEPAAMSAAIAASVFIDEQKVNVSEKRPYTERPKYPGQMGGPRGRGGRFGDNGGRGRFGDNRGRGRSDGPGRGFDSRPSMGGRGDGPDGGFRGGRGGRGDGMGRGGPRGGRGGGRSNGVGGQPRDAAPAAQT